MAEPHAISHEAGGADEVLFVRSVRVGLAAGRPAQSRVGDIYLEKDTDKVYFYTDSGWVYVSLS